MLLRELANELQGGSLVALRLNQHLEDPAFSINGAPEIHLLASHANRHLVQVPATVRLRTSGPQLVRDHRSKGEHPAPDGLIRHLDPTLGQELLDIPVAEGETQVEPDRALNDVAGEAGAGVEW